MPESADKWLDSAAARLPRWMAGVALVSALAALVSGHVRFAAGFALGSAVAILAYQWLHRAVAAALDSTESRPARTLMLKFAMRYPLLILVTILCYQSGWLSLRGMILGLFVPAAGALLEGLTLAGSILRNGWSRNPETIPADGAARHP
jgi:ATP synthase I chain